MKRAGRTRRTALRALNIKCPTVTGKVTFTCRSTTSGGIETEHGDGRQGPHCSASPADCLAIIIRFRLSSRYARWTVRFGADSRFDKWRAHSAHSLSGLAASACAAGGPRGPLPVVAVCMQNVHHHILIRESHTLTQLPHHRYMTQQCIKLPYWLALWKGEMCRHASKNIVEPTSVGISKRHAGDTAVGISFEPAG